MANRQTKIWVALVGLIVVGSALVVGIGAATGLHSPARSMGSATSAGATASVSGPNYTVTFSETGLTAGTNWSVRVCITQFCEDDDGAQFESTNNSSMTFSLPNGTYYYHVHAWNDTRANPSSGNFTVAGASPATINIHFGNPPTYPVTFTETGLASGTQWAVLLDLGWWSNCWAQDGGCNGSWSGWGSGWGGQGDQRPSTTAAPTVIKQDGGDWNGDGGSSGFNTSNTSTIQFFLPNGTYNFTIPNVTGYSIVGVANGTINVSGGAPPTVNVVFSALPSYTVTFDENGLANGTNWSVSVHGDGTFEDGGDLPAMHSFTRSFGTFQTTSNKSMSFMLPNGTYRYHVEEIDGYVVNGSWAASFNVSGAGLTITINFTALPEFNVTFNESGLPNGTDWGVRLVGHTGPLAHTHVQTIRGVHAAAGKVTFKVPAGKYHYKLIPLRGWKATGGFPGKTFGVHGSSVSANIVFNHKAPRFVAAVNPLAAIASSVVSGFAAAVRAAGAVRPF